MVRTADRAIKTGGKNLKATPSTSAVRSRSPSSGPSDRAYNSYNTVCPRETPKWQKPITSFFQTSEKLKSPSTNSNPLPANTDEVMEDVHLEAGSSKAASKEENVTNGDNDCEMEDNVLKIVAKIRPHEEDDTNLSSRKRRKLDTEVCANFELLETS